MKIIVKKGLDIPILGKAHGSLKTLPKPKQIALNLAPFEALRFRALVKVGEKVKIGQPLLETKGLPVSFLSPLLLEQLQKSVRIEACFARHHY